MSSQPKTLKTKETGVSVPAEASDNQELYFEEEGRLCDILASDTDEGEYETSSEGLLGRTGSERDVDTGNGRKVRRKSTFSSIESIGQMERKIGTDPCENLVVSGEIKGASKSESLLLCKNFPGKEEFQNSDNPEHVEIETRTSASSHACQMKMKMIVARMEHLVSSQSNHSIVDDDVDDDNHVKDDDNSLRKNVSCRQNGNQEQSNTDVRALEIIDGTSSIAGKKSQCIPETRQQISREIIKDSVTEPVKHPIEFFEGKERRINGMDVVMDAMGKLDPCFKPSCFTASARESTLSGFHRSRGSFKDNNDALSRIGGELAPLQHRLSEIAGKFRALGVSGLEINSSLVRPSSKLDSFVRRNISLKKDWTSNFNEIHQQAHRFYRDQNFSIHSSAHLSRGQQCPDHSYCNLAAGFSRTQNFHESQPAMLPTFFQPHETLNSCSNVTSNFFSGQTCHESTGIRSNEYNAPAFPPRKQKYIVKYEDGGEIADSSKENWLTPTISSFENPSTSFPNNRKCQADLGARRKTDKLMDSRVKVENGREDGCSSLKIRKARYGELKANELRLIYASGNVVPTATTTTTTTTVAKEPVSMDTDKLTFRAKKNDRLARNMGRRGKNCESSISPPDSRHFLREKVRESSGKKSRLDAWRRHDNVVPINGDTDLTYSLDTIKNSNSSLVSNFSVETTQHLMSSDFADCPARRGRLYRNSNDGQGNCELLGETGRWVNNVEEEEEEEEDIGEGAYGDLPGDRTGIRMNIPQARIPERKGNGEGRAKRISARKWKREATIRRWTKRNVAQKTYRREISINPQIDSLETACGGENILHVHDMPLNSTVIVNGDVVGNTKNPKRFSQLTIDRSIEVAVDNTSGHPVLLVDVHTETIPRTFSNKAISPIASVCTIDGSAASTFFQETRHSRENIFSLREREKSFKQVELGKSCCSSYDRDSDVARLTKEKGDISGIKGTRKQSSSTMDDSLCCCENMGNGTLLTGSEICKDHRKDEPWKDTVFSVSHEKCQDEQTFRDKFSQMVASCSLTSSTANCNSLGNRRVDVEEKSEEMNGPDFPGTECKVHLVRSKSSTKHARETKEERKNVNERNIEVEKETSIIRRYPQAHCSKVFDSNNKISGECNKEELEEWRETWSNDCRKNFINVKSKCEVKVGLSSVPLISEEKRVEEKQRMSTENEENYDKGKSIGKNCRDATKYFASLVSLIADNGFNRENNCLEKSLDDGALKDIKLAKNPENDGNKEFINDSTRCLACSLFSIKGEQRAEERVEQYCKRKENHCVERSINQSVCLQVKCSSSLVSLVQQQEEKSECSEEEENDRCQGLTLFSRVSTCSIIVERPEVHEEKEKTVMNLRADKDNNPPRDSLESLLCLTESEEGQQFFKSQGSKEIHVAKVDDKITIVPLLFAGGKLDKTLTLPLALTVTRSFPSPGTSSPFYRQSNKFSAGPSAILHSSIPRPRVSHISRNFISTGDTQGSPKFSSSSRKTAIPPAIDQSSLHSPRKCRILAREKGNGGMAASRRKTFRSSLSRDSTSLRDALTETSLPGPRRHLEMDEDENECDENRSRRREKGKEDLGNGKMERRRKEFRRPSISSTENLAKELVGQQIPNYSVNLSLQSSSSSSFTSPFSTFNKQRDRKNSANDEVNRFPGSTLTVLRAMTSSPEDFLGDT